MSPFSRCLPILAAACVVSLATRDLYGSTFDDVFRKAKASPAWSETVGELHTDGNFLSLVWDAKNQEYLAPAYQTLYKNLDETSRRLEAASESDETDTPAFLDPYPSVPGRVLASKRVALIDSGALIDHPLIKDSIDEVINVTDEPIPDECGHGTIQAIRQIWHEPRSRLVIIKAFGSDCRPTLRSLAEALERLRTLDIGYVFIAGGVDVNKFPSGRLICQLANLLVEEKGLHSFGFIATSGNIGDLGSWCPAEAEHVWALQAVDADSLKRPFASKSGGIAVAQKGSYISFPEITPKRMGVFFLEAAAALNRLGNSSAAASYVSKALDYPYSELAARISASALAAKQGDWQKADTILTNLLLQHPENFKALRDLALVKTSLREFDAARRLFDQALAKDDGDLLLIRSYARFLEDVEGDSDAALRYYVKAAEARSDQITGLLQFGSRLFYQDDFKRARIASQEVIRLDPTYAVAHYNIAAILALTGDLEAALIEIAKYEEATSSFDSSEYWYSPEEVRNTLSVADQIDMLATLEYIPDSDRGFAREFEILRSVLLSRTPAKDLAAFDEESLVHLADAAADYARRVLRRQRGALHKQAVLLLERVVERLELQEDRRSEISSSRIAQVRYGLAGLYHRLGRFEDAASSYQLAGDAFDTWSARGREASLAAKGFAQLAAGRYGEAKTSFTDAYSTSSRIVEGGGTAWTPRILIGRSLLTLHDGDSQLAIYEMESATRADEEDFEVLLGWLTIQLALSPPEESYDLIASIFLKATSDRWQAESFLRTLEDHTALDPVFGDLRASEYFRQLRSVFSKRHVSLVSSVGTSVKNLPIPRACTDQRSAKPKPSQKVRIAILGTGLADGHPCLDGRVFGVHDFTGEGGADQNGASTMQAVGLVATEVEASVPFELLNIKVLNKEGQGSVDSLIRGLLLAREAGVDQIMTHLQTSVVDIHLRGILRRVSELLIVATDPDDGMGNTFPLEGGQNVIVVSPE